MPATWLVQPEDPSMEAPLSHVDDAIDLVPLLLFGGRHIGSSAKSSFP
jgi:hypothetical protein